MDRRDEHAVYRLRLPGVDAGRRDEIRSSLVDLPGVAEVRFATANDIVVTADPAVVSDDELLAAIGESGVAARLA